MLSDIWPLIGSTVEPPELDFWRPRFEQLGGLGRSLEQVRMADHGLFDVWSREIDDGFAEVAARSRRVPIAVPTGLGSVTVYNADSGSVAIGGADASAQTG
ncbi:hypothetical protein JS562_55190, partial [Agrobacterium sp. S2]|nr:hypothetical protein [Agrobacterium sp. S2]